MDVLSLGHPSKTLIWYSNPCTHSTLYLVHKRKLEKRKKGKKIVWMKKNVKVCNIVINHPLRKNKIQMVWRGQSFAKTITLNNIQKIFIDSF